MTETAEQSKSEADTPTTPENATTETSANFERQALEAPPSLIAEFVDFLLHNKKWWLTPIILVLFLLGLFVVIGGSPAGPFIYSFF